MFFIVSRLIGSRFRALSHHGNRVSLIVLLTAMSLAAPRASAQTLPAGYQADIVYDGATSPTAMAFLGPDDFFVLEKNSGVVQHVRVDGPVPVSTTALDLDVSGNGEQGLLGIALSPDFAASGTVFIYYTNDSPRQNRVARYTWDGATLVNPIVLATLMAVTDNHNGGPLAIGPDGMLYAVIGDQGRFDRTQNNTVTSTVSETGIVLRMNPTDGSGPADNPFSALPGWQRVYAYGIRNCFGMTFDGISGVLWEAENGPNNYDEVNRIIAGANGGWTIIHGPDSRDNNGVADLVMNAGAAYVDPAFSWNETTAATGIAFLHGPRWHPSVRDDCVVASYKFNGTISRFDLNPGRSGFILTGGLADAVADSAAERDSAVWVSALGGLTDLRIGPDGYLYAVSINNDRIWRIRPQFPMGDVNRDGTVDGRDISLFVKVLLGTSTDPLEIAQSDMDGSGSVDAADLPDFIESATLPN